MFVLETKKGKRLNCELPSHELCWLEITALFTKQSYTDGSWKDPQRPFPIDEFMAFSGIVPVKVRNGSAGGFVNTIVNVNAVLSLEYC